MMGAIDWPAWVQAVGSVVAIVAAIVIDQGSARRQRAQFDHAEMVRKRDRVEVAMAAASLAGFAMRWTEHTQRDLKRPDVHHGISGPMFRKWVDVATEHYEALTVLRERVSDPLLLMHLLTFMHVRWRRKFGQLAKVGSTSMKDGLYDWEAEAVLG